MCYNASYDAERAFKKAIRDELNPDVRADLERKHEEWKQKNPDIYTEKPASIKKDQRFFTSAFEHDAFPIAYFERSKQFGFMQWGLVPRWCRSEDKALKLWNQCINARSETMFEKPSFKASSLDRRCVIYMTGFFEYHHQGSKRIPFFIQDSEADTMLVGGLWEEATIVSKVWRTFTIVTVPANDKMSLIHNNPKNPNRMPLILRPDQVDEWINPTQPGNKPAMDRLKSDLILPYPSDGLKYTSVAQLQGKAGVGDSEKAHEVHAYPELDILV